MLEGKDLSLIYGNKKDAETIALSKSNILIDDNKFYGILGPSGSGKSSLLYMLSGLRKPTEGKVIFNGVDIWSLKEKELDEFRHKNFGFVFQRHFLIDYLTALQNVVVPLNSNNMTAYSKAKEILIKLGLEKELNKKPYELSGGQRQRIAIARALITDPKVIFGDELTASLDSKTSNHIMDILKELKTTLVLVTHDESILEGADKIFRIRDGLIK